MINSLSDISQKTVATPKNGKFVGSKRGILSLRTNSNKKDTADLQYDHHYYQQSN